MQITKDIYIKALKDLINTSTPCDHCVNSHIKGHPDAFPASLLLDTCYWCLKLIEENKHSWLKTKGNKHIGWLIDLERVLCPCIKLGKELALKRAIMVIEEYEGEGEDNEK